MLFALSVARAVAAFPTSRLVYVRGPGTNQCPDQDVMRQAVASRLGYDPFFPASDKTIVAKVVLESAHLKGEVELVDERGLRVGLREFTGEPDKCSELVSAMALSISIAIDPNSAEAYAKGPPDEPATASDPAAPEKPPSVAAAPSERARPRPAASATEASATRGAPVPPSAITWSIGAGLNGVFATEPNPTLGLAVSASGRSGALSLGFEGCANLPVTAEREAVTFRTSTYALRAVPCVHFGFASACELTSLDWIDATGTESGAKSGAQVLASFGARLAAELMLGPRFGLLAHADLLASPWPVRLEAGGQTLWETRTATGGVGVAATLHFQ